MQACSVAFQRPGRWLVAWLLGYCFCCAAHPPLAATHSPLPAGCEAGHRHLVSAGPGKLLQPAGGAAQRGCGRRRSSTGGRTWRGRRAAGWRGQRRRKRQGACTPSQGARCGAGLNALMIPAVPGRVCLFWLGRGILMSVSINGILCFRPATAAGAGAEGVHHSAERCQGAPAGCGAGTLRHSRAAGHFFVVLLLYLVV